MKLAPNKANLLTIMLLAISSSLITYLFTGISAYLLGHTALNNTSIILTSLLIFISGSTLLHYFFEEKFKSISLAMSHAYIVHTWTSIINSPYDVAEKFNSTEMNKRINDYESAITQMINHSFFILSNLFLLLLLFAYLFYCQSGLTALYLFTGLILLGTKAIFYKKLKHHREQHLNCGAQADLFVSESLAQIHKIKTAHIEQYILKKWLLLLHKTKRLLIKLTILETRMWLIDAASFAMLILTTLAYHPSAAFLICACQVALCHERLSNNLLALFNAHIATKQLYASLPPIEKHTSPQHIIPSYQGDICLTHVAFKHLNDINITLEAGSFVGLTGASGSGKSTLFKLILGLIPDYSGIISLDKHDIQKLDMRAMRRHFGVVLQTSHLFPGTIFSNICVNTQLTLDEVWELVHLVGLADEANAMPMKLFTHISDNPGDSLSGGQKQKILIARALATRPKVLFLDEATSALDNDSQAIIFHNLQSLNITRFVIAHRLSTLEKADKIYNLANGHVIMINKKT